MPGIQSWVVIVAMESKPDQPNNRLLIVDDEEAMRESLKALFQDQYEIEVCSTGEEAIALSRKEPFTIALIDMLMEGMLGVEVLKELKEISPLTEVIIITAYPAQETISKARAFGAFSFVGKPFKSDHLKEVVKKCQDHFDFMRR